MTPEAGRNSDPEGSLGELARQMAPAVLEEALHLARRRARDEIAELLTRAIVADALSGHTRAIDIDEDSSQPAGEDEPEVATVSEVPAGAEVPVNTERGLYAYAISRAEPLELAGVTGVAGTSEVQVVPHRALGLVVTEVSLADLQHIPDEDVSETSRIATMAREHDAVVRAVFERGPVLPLRMGTVVPDRAAAARLLEERYDQAVARLDRLERHREWGVRLTPSSDDDETSPRSESGAPGPDEAVSGTAYINRRRSEVAATERRRDRIRSTARSVHEVLSAHALDNVRRSGTTLPLDAAYLVDRSSEAVFFSEIERLANEFSGDGVLLEVTGPWPPYSFASMDTEGVAGA